MEYMAEKQFVKADRIYRWRALAFGIPFTASASMPPGALGKLIEAQRLIASGRKTKTNIDAYRDFKQAFEITTDLVAPVTPLRFGLGVVAFTLTIMAATIAIMLGLRHFLHPVT